MKYSPIMAAKFLPLIMLFGAPVSAQTPQLVQAQTPAPTSQTPTLVQAQTPTPAPQNNNILRADLSGLQEVPPFATAATGQFRAQIDPTANTIAFELSYQALEGAAQEAHIHFGQSGVSGGISVFLCSNLSNPPAGAQSCPASSGTVTGTIQASDVLGPTAQGIAAAEIAKLLAAIRAGVAYVNVHSTKAPNGEIRGQITPPGAIPGAGTIPPSAAAPVPAQGAAPETALPGTTGSGPGSSVSPPGMPSPTYSPLTAPGTLAPFATPNATSPGAGNPLR